VYNVLVIYVFLTCAPGREIRQPQTCNLLQSFKMTRTHTYGAILPGRLCLSVTRFQTESCAASVRIGKESALCCNLSFSIFREGLSNLAQGVIHVRVFSFHIQLPLVLPQDRVGDPAQGINNISAFSLLIQLRLVLL
jgi:hypothetical protein